MGLQRLSGRLNFITQNIKMLLLTSLLYCLAVFIITLLQTVLANICQLVDFKVLSEA